MGLLATGSRPTPRPDATAPCWQYQNGGAASEDYVNKGGVRADCAWPCTLRIVGTPRTLAITAEQVEPEHGAAEPLQGWFVLFHTPHLTSLIATLVSQRSTRSSQHRT